MSGSLRQGSGPPRVLVIEPLDRTSQSAGMPAAQALAAAFARSDVRVAAIVRRPASVLSSKWLLAQCQRWDTSAAITATVSAWNLQADRHRAYVAMTGLLLSTDGDILWAERNSGTAPWNPALHAPEATPSALIAALPACPGCGAKLPIFSNLALSIAACNAAKEFATDVEAHL